jgi:hypothetical protein
MVRGGEGQCSSSFANWDNASEKHQHPANQDRVRAGDQPLLLLAYRNWAWLQRWEIPKRHVADHPLHRRRCLALMFARWRQHNRAAPHSCVSRTMAKKIPSCSGGGRDLGKSPDPCASSLLYEPSRLSTANRLSPCASKTMVHRREV